MTGKWHRVAAGSAIVLFFLLLAVLFTWPVLTQGRHATVKDPGDPTFNAWTLAWDARVLVRNPLNLFNANIFFPNRYTLAYSEQQVVTAVLAMPALAATGNPVYSSNLVLILEFFLCSLGAYLLLMHLTRNRLAAVVAGVVYAYAPYKLAHITHLPLLAAGFIPLALLFLHRYAEGGRKTDAGLFALFFVLQALSTWYYGLILAVGVVVFLAVRAVISRGTYTLRWALTLAVALALALLVIVPFALPYLKLNKDDPRFKRGVMEVDSFSADVQDFLVAPGESLVWGGATSALRDNTKTRGGASERSLFPGLAALVLGAAGIWYLFRRRKEGGEPRFSLWFYVSLLVVSVILCLGTSLYVFGHRLNLPMPYELLYRFVPGFKALRVPPRFDILVALSLAVFSGYAVKGLIAWLGGKRGIALAAGAAIAIAGLVVLDTMSVSIPMYRVPLKDEFPAVYSWLERQQGEAPTVEIPLATYDPATFKKGLQFEPTWLAFESQRTYYSTLHWKKILNGYSGFIPSTYYASVFACRDFPSDGAFELFRKYGIEYVLVHGEQAGPRVTSATQEWAGERGDIVEVARFGTDVVYRIK